MTANGWLALIIMVVANGIVAWTLFTGVEPVSRQAKRWFFIVANGVGLVLAISQWIWMDF